METKQNNIAGIVLAAGEGKRIGKTKALIEIDGISFLERVIVSLEESNCVPIVVVGGSKANDVEKLSSKLNVDFIWNNNWRSGQFSSLKAGLSSLNPRPFGALITLVDHPFVTAGTYELLCKTFLTKPDTIVIPVYGKRKGHPIVIPAAITDEVLNAPDESNLRKIISSHQSLITKLPVDDPGILKDVDTINDLKEMKTE
jgi:CTP:molybdopterin cytidylyltransferase MocA